MKSKLYLIEWYTFQQKRNFKWDYTYEFLLLQFENNLNFYNVAKLDWRISLKTKNHSFWVYLILEYISICIC